MLVHKDYQTPKSLQAIYNAKNATSKLFLGIVTRCTPGKWTWLNRAPLAKDADVSIRHQTRLADELVELGVIEKQSHGSNRSHPSAYKVTQFGYEVKRIFEQIYSINKYVVLSTCLLLSPAQTNVPLLSYDVFKTGVVRLLSERELLTARRRDPQTTHILQTTPRKEVDVGSKEHKRMDLPEHVVSLTPLLQLTTHGQLKLSMFDKETVDYAWEAVKLTSGCKDIFKELIDLCLQYCKDNELAVDWKTYYEALEAGLASKKDFCTKKRITSAMIKPRVAKEPSNPFQESQALINERNRDKSQDPERWIDKHVKDNPGRHAALQREYLSIIEAHVGKEAPADVLSRLGIKEVEVEVLVRKEWSQTDKQLVDWALDYINKMSMGKQFYTHYVDEIMLGPDSPRAKTGELQSGLKLMQRLYFMEIANKIPDDKPQKQVTEIKDEIVCPAIEKDDENWANAKFRSLDGGELENLKYSPGDDYEAYEEVLD